MMIFLYLVIGFIIATFLGGYLLSTTPYQGPRSDHFNGKRFQNPSRRSAKGFSAVFKYVFTRKRDKWTKNYESYHRTDTPPVPSPDQVQYTFVNHSTFLIQHQGLHILTDPIWSDRCSPFQWAGPQRMRPPGLAFDALPDLDVVLISHNHYDHLDKNTIQKINLKHSPTYITSLGVGNYLKSIGCEKIIELDWWQSHDFQGINFKAVPANHFSSRGTFDRNTSLWSGFVMRSTEKSIYFLGDSGYSNIFKEIGQREGPFDLSLIPIGAYLPRWFMSPIHISPEESVKVHIDVQSKKSVAMHFGTFPLADDNPERSQTELKKAIAAAKISEAEFMIPDEGEVYSID